MPIDCALKKLESSGKLVKASHVSQKSACSNEVPHSAAGASGQEHDERTFRPQLKSQNLQGQPL